MSQIKQGALQTVSFIHFLGKQDVYTKFEFQRLPGRNCNRYTFKVVEYQAVLDSIILINTYTDYDKLNIYKI